MRKLPLLFIALAVALALAIWSTYPGGWWGMMGPNWMAGPGAWSGHGRGMMREYEPGVTGSRWNAPWQNLDLSTDDVKSYFDRWIAWLGNPRLKVGEVKEKDADTIVADIVTKDNSLVQRFVVNRRNGFIQPSED
jgi:hypothetical protein